MKKNDIQMGGRIFSSTNLREVLEFLHSDAYGKILETSQEQIKEAKEILDQAVKDKVIDKMDIYDIGIFISVTGKMIVIPEMSKRRLLIKEGKHENKDAESKNI